VVAYSYLVSPVVMPVLSPLGRFVPAWLKEVLS
jgi:CDP-diacylglycerol--serine O-phosphatidyltransferase